MPTVPALLAFALATAAAPGAAPQLRPAEAPIDTAADEVRKAPPAPRPRSAFGAAIAEMTRTLRDRPPAADAEQADPGSPAQPPPDPHAGRTAAHDRNG